MPSRITVGICAYNEERNIGKLLQNLLSDQGLSEDSEILVVCSGCTDNTVPTIQQIARKDARVKIHLEAQRTGKASAINYILTHAKNENILLISADTMPAKHIVPKLAAKLQEPNVGIACANPVPVNHSNSLVGRIVHALWSFHRHVFEQLNDAGLARHASEAFCIRKGIVGQIPSGTVNDDAFLALAVVKRGWKIKFLTDCPVYMCGPKTFPEYFGQRRRVVFGHYQLRKLTGQSPQYLAQMAPLHPLRAAKWALWLLQNFKLTTILVFLATEFMVNVAGIADFARGKSHLKWQVLTSTKTVFE